MSEVSKQARHLKAILAFLSLPNTRDQVSYKDLLNIMETKCEFSSLIYILKESVKKQLKQYLPLHY